MRNDKEFLTFSAGTVLLSEIWDKRNGQAYPLFFLGYIPPPESIYTKIEILRWENFVLVIFSSLAHIGWVVGIFARKVTSSSASHRQTNKGTELCMVSNERKFDEVSIPYIIFENPWRN